LIAGVAANTAVEQDSTAVVQSNEAEMVEAVPQIDAESDVEEADEEALDEEMEEVEDEADEEEGGEEEAEVEAEDEEEADDEAEDEEEEETEDEVFLEAAADAEVDEEGKPKKKPAMIVPKNGPKAPAAITKPFKFHPERIEASTNKFEDPEMAKLNLALEAVKEDILSTNKQITDERKWVIAVAKIIASYNDKMKRVEAHIIALRKEMKALYRKKKQIENLKLQKALEAKLKEARDELATLTHSLKHVAVKQGELNRSGADLRQTIAGIQAQLAKLRGQQLRSPRPAPRKRCGKGKRYSKKAKKCVARKGRKARKPRKSFGKKL